MQMIRFCSKHKRFNRAVVHACSGRLSLILISASLALSLPVQAVDYTPSDIDGWQNILFDGKTQYQQLAECVQANANDSASGLIQQQRISVDDKTRLSWSWRAETPLQLGPDEPDVIPEKTKSGDDFVARAYVIHESPFFWQTKAINYVWSREHPVGTSWPNPFTRNAIMVVVQSGTDGLGQWHSFERNIREDFARFHQMDVDRIDAIAVMTDADNTNGQAQACYQLPEISA
jgi:hypothetical protein